MARRTSILFAGLTAAALAGAALVGAAPAAQASSSDNSGFLAHLNGLRAAHGLPALSWSGDLASIAASHSQAMSAQQTIFHNGSLTSEVSNWQVLGENVGMGGSVDAIDSAFDQSPEHYANEVSSSYTQVGIGTASDSRGYLYVTLDFRKPMNAAAPAPAVHAAPARAAAPPAAPVAPSVRVVAHQPVSAAAPAPAAAPAVAPAVVPAAPAAPVAPAVSPAAVVHSLPVPQGTDPVANALAFSRLLAGMQ